jgi:hypothetical protein
VSGRVRRAALAGAGLLALALALAGCGGGGKDSGGLTAHDRKAAQTAVDGLRGSNIAYQMVTITRWVQNPPSACRIHLASRNPDTYAVYVFWTPYLAAEPYVWLNMKLTGDPKTSSFQMGTSEPVLLPGGKLSANGQKVNPLSVDTTLLSRYGPKQVEKTRKTLRAHGGDAFAKPGAGCQLLTNGSLRLVPNT